MTSPSMASHMQTALDQARLAAKRGEVPVGAVLVGSDGEVLSTAGNEIRALRDPTAHAEILVIRKAAEKLGSERLINCDLYVTLEPCAMCAGAISLARIRRLYFAAGDAKGGGVIHGARVFSQPTCHHAPDIYDGIEEEAARGLLKDFFAHQRQRKS
ncbi:MAG: nucleoside deaminase [Hyphomicrobiaceae bacterium]